MASLIEDALVKAGWTLHHGGPCPIEENSYPVTLEAGGDTDCEIASDAQWEWSADWPSTNVIAYRVVV